MKRMAMASILFSMFLLGCLLPTGPAASNGTLTVQASGLTTFANKPYGLTLVKGSSIDITINSFNAAGNMNLTTDELEAGTWELTFEVSMDSDYDFTESGIDYAYETTVTIDGNQTLNIVEGNLVLR